MTQKSAVAGNTTPAVPMTAEQRATFDRDGDLITAAGPVRLRSTRIPDPAAARLDAAAADMLATGDGLLVRAQPDEVSDLLVPYADRPGWPSRLAPDGVQGVELELGVLVAGGDPAVGNGAAHGPPPVRPGTSTFPDTLATSPDIVRKPPSRNFRW
jgi:hypothetical protein